MQTSTLLEVQNLKVARRTEKSPPDTADFIVKGIHLTVHKAAVTGLIGESGCGKSMTCLAIMGLLPDQIRQVDGDIRFMGQSLGQLPKSRVRGLRGKIMAMVLQNPMSCFDAVFTIRQHFKETLVSHGFTLSEAVNRKITEALAEAGFDNPSEILDLYPFQMSGGMLQRVMVALALLMDVALLIADEPTTDLDVVSQARILDLLESMRCRHRMAILLVTHDLSIIARMADEVLVMRNGAVVDSGKTCTLFNHPSHPYTRSLLTAHLSLYSPRLSQFSRPTG